MAKLRQAMSAISRRIADGNAFTLRVMPGESMHPITLRFRSPVLERAWRTHRAMDSRASYRATLLLTVALYLGFILLDRTALPGVAGRLLAVRGVVCGLLLVLFLVSEHARWPRLHPWAVAAAIAVSGGGIVALLAAGREEASLHWAGILLALMAIHGLYRPRLPIAIGASILLIAAFDVVMLSMGESPTVSLVSANFFLAAATVIGSYASYGLELTSRERFVAMHRLEEERRRSERLLRNILPEPIARRLKAGEEPIADFHAAATVLFADIVGFTAMTERMEPSQLVGFLDRVFREFEAIAHEQGVEKVKTIGDACMLAAGLPEPQDDHVARIAEAALSIRDRLGRSIGAGEERFRIRIGIATGPVVAGVIGHTKFSYDMWGDVVNTASRMASVGVDDRIQVTGDVVRSLDDRYVFSQRGHVQIKGKGDLETWFLEDRRQAAAPQDEGVARPSYDAPAAAATSASSLFEGTVA